MRTSVDLLVPLKELHRAKSRLRGAADGGLGDPAHHARLTLALARDTVAAANAATRVSTVTVVSSDPTVARTLRADGVRVLPDPPGGGLNAALRHGAAELAGTGAAGVTGALQADLPALRPVELDAALDAALTAFAAGADGAFCADEQGTGTTLLLTAPGVALLPRFGPGSAGLHAEQGSAALTGHWPGLRLDVDTAADLAAAEALGLGEYTRAVIADRSPWPGVRRWSDA